MKSAKVQPRSAHGSDDHFMARALELAAQGEGCVEPNPMVGAVVVREGQIVGEGWHSHFGGPHAEVIALAAAGDRAVGATLYITLEPCCHTGKTPPCTDAICNAKIARVVVACGDPFGKVNGAGISALREAGIESLTGVREAEARQLLAPYLKRLSTGRPWTLAKWAMTLDGKIATRSGESQWISNESSRAVGHRLRGRVDAVMIGSGTARVDDPLLTARLENREDVKRIATRIVIDSNASLSLDSRLVQTAAEVPLLLAVAVDAPQEQCTRLTDARVEVFRCSGKTHADRLDFLLEELGNRQMTNLLVEGGSRLLGTLWDLGAIDEVHTFLGPKIVGGAGAVGPIAGEGIGHMTQSRHLTNSHIELLDGDVYLRGRLE